MTAVEDGFDGHAMRVVSLPDSPLAAGRARRVVAELLGECGLSDAVGADVAVLLTSEAVTNAYQHAAPELMGTRQFRLEVSVRDRGETVRVAVHDPDPGVPVACSASPLDERGRGLALIEGQAAKYGVDVDRDGKTFWFECVLGGDW